MSDSLPCVICGQAGAEWLLRVNSDAPQRVHKPCGTRTVAQAPTGVTAKVYPSQELREKWAGEQREREARNFWTEKFQNASARVGEKSPKAHLALVA